MALSPEEVKQIAEELAPILVSEVRKDHHDFWVDPETHYNDHKAWAAFKKEIGGEGVYDLKNILNMYRTTKSLWFRAFLGCAALGTVILIAASMGFYKG